MFKVREEHERQQGKKRIPEQGHVHAHQSILGMISGDGENLENTPPLCTPLKDIGILIWRPQP